MSDDCIFVFLYVMLIPLYNYIIYPYTILNQKLEAMTVCSSDKMLMVIKTMVDK